MTHREGADRADEAQIAVSVGGRLDGRRLGHEVLHAQHLQVLDPFGHVRAGRVVESAHRVGRLLGQLRRVQEVVRGRGG